MAKRPYLAIVAACLSLASAGAVGARELTDDSALAITRSIMDAAIQYAPRATACDVEGPHPKHLQDAIERASNEIKKNVNENLEIKLKINIENAEFYMADRMAHVYVGIDKKCIPEAVAASKGDFDAALRGFDNERAAP